MEGGYASVGHFHLLIPGAPLPPSPASDGGGDRGGAGRRDK